jgi:hypothetical protein
VQVESFVATYEYVLLGERETFDVSLKAYGDQIKETERLVEYLSPFVFSVW